MLETTAIIVVALAQQLGTIATATTSISGSLAAIVTGFGAALLSVSGACAGIATLLPAPNSVGFYAKMYKVVNVAGFNFGQAANKIKSE